MIRYATLDQAQKMVQLWNGDASTVKHIGDFGNSVFKFDTVHGQPQILRFTDLNFRTENEVDGELEYLEFSKLTASPTCYPIRTLKNELKITLEDGSSPLICSSLTFASGEIVNEKSPFWTVDFFKEWGRNLAAIHRNSRNFKGVQKRWVWDKELLLRQAENLIPEDDLNSKEQFKFILSELSALQKNSDNFGLIHADHAPQNFHYNSLDGRITAFDFGNCCHHWYIADLAISLSTVRSKPNKEEIKNGILHGYTESLSLPKNFEALIDLFIKLRVVYVYLSRLHLFGISPTEDQKKTLTSLREKVHSSKGW